MCELKISKSAIPTAYMSLFMVWDDPAATQGADHRLLDTEALCISPVLACSRTEEEKFRRGKVKALFDLSC